ncbi:S1C family serine protease [Pedococcus sp. P5_B7]
MTVTVAPDGAAPSTQPTTNGASAVESSGFSDWERAALRVRNIECLGVSSGSGFAIAPRFFVTNRHVVQDSLAIQVSGYDGRDLEVKAVGATLIADLAVVETAQDLPHTLTLSSQDPPVGEHITVVGYPEGGELKSTEGHVLSYVADPLLTSNELMMENDAPIRPGSSGSAVINDQGEVVGIAYAGSATRRYAVPVSLLNGILDNPNRASYNPACGETLPDDDEYTQCSATVSAGSNTSCPFALAVESAWIANGRQDGVVVARSPVTKKTYEMRCQAGTHLASCYGGDRASVVIALR